MSKLHDILCSRAIMNNEDRAIIEPQIKALMLELIGDNSSLDDNAVLKHKAELRKKVAKL